jgi:hypothetical protein
MATNEKTRVQSVVSRHGPSRRYPRGRRVREGAPPTIDRRYDLATGADPVLHRAPKAGPTPGGWAFPSCPLCPVHKGAGRGEGTGHKKILGGRDVGRATPHPSHGREVSRIPLLIKDSRHEDGAFMEPSGRNQSQPVANGRTSKTAETSQNRCRGLRPVAERSAGKEGVDGSSPSEGSAKAPQSGAFSLASTCMVSSVQWVWSPLRSLQVQNRRSRSRRPTHSPEYQDVIELTTRAAARVDIKAFELDWRISEAIRAGALSYPTT